MKKFIVSLFALISLSTLALADIPREFRKGSCKEQRVQNQKNDREIEIVDGLLCRNLYSHVQLLEIEVENIDYIKEIYLYDHTEQYDFDKTIKAFPVSDPEEVGHKDGAVFYLGKTRSGRDRFIISLVSVFRSGTAPIDVYVKMGRKQYEATGVRFR